MSKSNIYNYTMAHIRIQRYLDAYDDYERRKAEADAAKQRLDEAMAAMTDYDKQVFEKAVKANCGEEVLHAASLD